MTLDIHPLALVLFVLAPVVSALAGAALAARWMRRPEEQAPPDLNPGLAFTAQTHLDATSQLMTQLRALQCSQDSLHLEVIHCREALARVHRQLLAKYEPGGRIDDPLPSPPKKAQQAAPQPQPQPPVRTPESAQPVPSPSRSLSPPLQPPSSPPSVALQPLPRPQPVALAAAPEVELTDDEIDALPPELPAPATPHKRVLPPPRKPMLNRL